MNLQTIQDAIIATAKELLPGLAQCEEYAGQFGPDGPNRGLVTAPAFFLAVIDARASAGGQIGDGRTTFDVRFAAFCLARNAAGASQRSRSAMAMAETFLLRVPYAKWGIEGDEVSPVQPDQVDSLQNLYSTTLDSKGFALWSVTWTQTVQLDESIWDALPDFLPDNVAVGDETLVEPLPVEIIGGVVEADGDTVIIIFNQPVSGEELALGWSLTADGEPIAIQGAGQDLGEPDRIALFLEEDAIGQGQIVLVSFDAEVGQIQGESGVMLESVVDHEVVNNSTVAPAGCLIGLEPWDRDETVEPVGEAGTFLDGQTFGAVDVTSTANHFVKAQDVALGYQGIRWFEISNDEAGWTTDYETGRGRTGVHVVEQGKDPLPALLAGAPDVDVGKQLSVWPLFNSESDGLVWNVIIFDGSGVVEKTIPAEFADHFYIGIGGDGEVYARLNSAEVYLHRISESLWGGVPGVTIYGDVLRIFGTFSASTNIETTASNFANPQYGGDLCGNNAGGTAPPAITCTLDLQYYTEMEALGKPAAFDPVTGRVWIDDYDGSATPYLLAEPLSSMRPVSGFCAGRVIGLDGVWEPSGNNTNLVIADFLSGRQAHMFPMYPESGALHVLLLMHSPEDVVVYTFPCTARQTPTLGVDSSGNVLVFVDGDPAALTYVVGNESILPEAHFDDGSVLAAVATNAPDVSVAARREFRVLADATQLPIHPPNIRTWCEQPLWEGA